MDTGPAPAASLKRVPCPRCGIQLHEVPPTWGVWVLPHLRKPATASPESFVKHCYGRKCQRAGPDGVWLEIVQGPRVTLRMTAGWVRVG